MQHIQLTLDQENAAHEFAVFMASPAKEFVISGPAGVGKTTLLRHLRDMRDNNKVAQLLGRQVLTDWAFTATTNKAAEVLGEALGEPASTIHSFLGLKVFNDFSSGKTKISRTRNSEVKEKMLIVIDECSMVDKQLHKLIHECTIDCKILYVGDHCQMAPVMEDLSVVFQNNQPAVLNEIVRSQHTPAITALCQQLRETVETGVFKPIQAVPGIIDFLDEQEAETAIVQDFVLNDQEDRRILGYTNQFVIQMNRWIRTARGLPDTFSVGEHVISNAATRFSNIDGMTRVEQPFTIESVGLSYDEVIEYKNTMYSMQSYEITTSGGACLVISLEPEKLAQLLKEFKRVAAWPQFFALQERFADLRPRHACTAYKAQGSTYNTVYVHLGNIGSCTYPSQAARMLYVACSRATHHIRFLGSLPARFSGVTP